MTIFEKLLIHKNQNLPFVAYKNINENTLCAYFQKDDSIQQTSNFTESGFVFSSFDSSQNIVFTAQNSDFITEDFIADAFVFTKNKNQFENSSAKESYIQLVEKTISEIQATNCTKIVVSRKETIDVAINPIIFFKKLLHFNPSAFTYIWFHPKIGMWLGAFSEQLLKIERNILSTMSLAGTQKIVDGQLVEWKSKEIEEQQIVTNFIIETIKDDLEIINIAHTETIFVGNVAHLKSDISGNLRPNYNLNNIIKSLHPTPAVCGFPKVESKSFILKNENYNREFYAGFLGELNRGENNSDANLFVNLRCLKVNHNSVDIFVGGGITKDSIPKKEWEETVNKTQTIKALL